MKLIFNYGSCTTLACSEYSNASSSDALAETLRSVAKSLETSRRCAQQTLDSIRDSILKVQELSDDLIATYCSGLQRCIEDNNAILRRERHREQLYDSAQRMKVAGKTLSALSLSGQRALSIEIDEMTPCLRRLSDNQLVKTTFKRVNPKKGEYSDWLFNWDEIAKDPDVDIVLELNAEGDNRPQGLLAMKDRPKNKTVAVADVETAPHNRTFKNGINSKEYNGVGAHLFAEAVKRSYELGFDGVIEFAAKSNLVKYYEKELGATQITSTRMFLDEQAAEKLYKRYYGDLPR